MISGKNTNRLGVEDRAGPGSEPLQVTNLERTLIDIVVRPYHQPIGFLMQNAGYPEESCAKLRELGLNPDFYLAHALRQPEYSKDWRLFYPKDLR